MFVDIDSEALMPTPLLPLRNSELPPFLVRN